MQRLKQRQVRTVGISDCVKQKGGKQQVLFSVPPTFLGQLFPESGFVFFAVAGNSVGILYPGYAGLDADGFVPKLQVTAYVVQCFGGVASVSVTVNQYLFAGQIGRATSRDGD